MKLNQDIVKNLAALAKLDLSTEELATYQKQLVEVLSYVEKINTLDLKNINESLSGTAISQATLRDDKSEDSRADIIDQVANQQDSYVVTPGVFSK